MIEAALPGKNLGQAERRSKPTAAKFSGSLLENLRSREERVERTFRFASKFLL